MPCNITWNNVHHLMMHSSTCVAITKCCTLVMMWIYINLQQMFVSLTIPRTVSSFFFLSQMSVQQSETKTHKNCISKTYKKILALGQSTEHTQLWINVLWNKGQHLYLRSQKCLEMAQLIYPLVWDIILSFLPALNHTLRYLRPPRVPSHHG